MSGIDPQILIYKLSELTEEIKRCTNIQRDTIRQALYTQTHAQEHVNRKFHHAGSVVHQVECDRQNIEGEKIDVTQQLSKCIQATETSHATLREVESALKIATTTLNKWNAELHKALQWLTRAEARLQRAVAEYQAAQTNVQYAKNAVDRAEAALRRCMNDKERTNCNSEGRAYESARGELLIAIARLEAAEVELRLAQEEVERAKARVHCCQNAVSYAEQAVGYAQEALEHANQAVNSAERSLEEVEAAERHIVAAEEKVNEEQEIADEMMQKVRQAETLSNQGFSVYFTGYKAGEYAQRLATLGCQEIEYRVEQLHSFNLQDDNRTLAVVTTSLLSFLNRLANSFDDKHGSIYKKAQQEFLKSLANDPKQPKYVQGWIKQELNRYWEYQKAKATRKKPPNSVKPRNSRRIKSIPGFDVGHKYPGINLPSTFRLEGLSENRHRGGKYKR